MRNISGLLAFFVLSLPFAVLPFNLAVEAGGLLGLVVCRLWHKRRLIALANLRAASESGSLHLSESPEALVRECFRNLGRSLAEVIKIFYGLGDHIVRGVRVLGMEHFEAARTKGRGVILVTGHCGNWELTALALARAAGGLGVVARPIENPYLNRVIEKVRSRYGSTVIHKKGALRAMMSMLKSGGSVGILMDQSVLPQEGVLIGFLGMPAWTSRMPAAIAKRTSSPVLPIFIRRSGRGHEVTIYPEVELSGDEAGDTARLSGYLENYITENPAEWLWIHRRWKRTEGVAPAAQF
jgi:KDO2-lipid IV(A) lauroyltransferase